MPSTVTDKNASVEPLGELTVAYLKECGYPKGLIDSYTGKTRLLHDLGMCGDDILGEFKVLHEKFGVDLSDFEFDKYFPSELSTDAYYIAISGILRSIGLRKIADRLYRKALARIHGKYAEVTFEMLEEVIKQRKWIF